QAEDGIRDFHVTGVQTCALPISAIPVPVRVRNSRRLRPPPLSTCGSCCGVFRGSGFLSLLVTGSGLSRRSTGAIVSSTKVLLNKSEERRVGNECRSDWTSYERR